MRYHLFVAHLSLYAAVFLVHSTFSFPARDLDSLGNPSLPAADKRRDGYVSTEDAYVASRKRTTIQKEIARDLFRNDFPRMCKAGVEGAKQAGQNMKQHWSAQQHKEAFKDLCSMVSRPVKGFCLGVGCTARDGAALAHESLPWFTKDGKERAEIATKSLIALSYREKSRNRQATRLADVSSLPSPGKSLPTTKDRATVVRHSNARERPATGPITQHFPSRAPKALI